MYGEPANELAIALAEAARELLAQRTVQDTLERITELAVECVEGCQHAGILLVRPGRRVETTAATSPLVVDSNEAQVDLGEGPCFDAARQEQTYRVVDMRSERRWPRYGPRALELGIGSMMGFQLFAEEDNLGALDMYSERPYAFTPVSEQAGRLFASHAAVALVGARETEQLDLVVETRQQMGEALGRLMERHGISRQDAFAMVKEAARERNVQLREIADAVATTGELPAPRTDSGATRGRVRGSGRDRRGCRTAAGG